MGRAGRAEPFVVGDVHKDGSAVQGELADFAGKNRLVANERSQSDAIFIERIALGAAGEGPNLAGEWLSKADEILKRNEFAEGNKVDFVVAINPGSVRSNQRCGVVDVGWASGFSCVLDAHGAHDDERIRRARDFAQRAAQV